ncbi:acylneuraminate cytidylyltransferase family protein [Salinicola tamaricis]|uniref:acylneuraminate cytidylyltransferase family protein n=1 Tax=Salinicola tamaricis TaxID=1771309 RepID=UPI001F5C0F40|nr:acylneuraminate cytidylyltransferase family protein [Salinicola tamaricis]
MRLAVIPARGASGFRARIKAFCGKPMIAWSIQAALASRCFDRVIVSTDDDEIAAVAREWGAETPFTRPAALSDDHTGTLPVIAHAITEIQQAGVSLEAVCCLYATAPFASADDLISGLDRLEGGTSTMPFR